MSLRLYSENWNLSNADAGLVVTLKQRELDFKAIRLLVDEIAELADERANANIRVDCRKVRRLAGTAFGKFINLSKKLRERDGCLVLDNVDARVYQSLRAARLTENLDIRACPTGA